MPDTLFSIRSDRYCDVLHQFVCAPVVGITLLLLHLVVLIVNLVVIGRLFTSTVFVYTDQ